MKMLKKIRKVHIITAIVIVVYSILLVNVVQAVSAVNEPGSSENPLVAKDYVDSSLDKLSVQVNNISPKMNQLTQDNAALTKTVESLTATINGLNTQITDLKKQIDKANQSDNQQPGGSSTVADVKVKAGKQLIGGENTEIILLSGNAAVISPSGSGLLNVTTGKFFTKGTSILKNNVMLVIKADGRGFKAINECRALVIGSYTIK